MTRFFKGGRDGGREGGREGGSVPMLQVSLCLRFLNMEKIVHRSAKVSLDHRVSPRGTVP